MKRFYPLILSSLLIVGCSGEDSASDNASAAEASLSSPSAEPETPLATDLARPDANVPANEEGAFPLGWQVRLDRPNAEAIIGADSTADVHMVNMVPGWHFRTGSPRVILYHPASTATGSYTISSKIHLFDPGQRTEAYGLIFGGSDLDNENQTYLYFVIRRTGEFLVKHRVGDDTHVIKNWTANDAIVPYEAGVTEGMATNTLSVTVDGKNVAFFVNGEEVHTMTANSPTDGLVGFRFNHSVEAHIETLDVTM